jgi:hypothetical protein
VISSRRELRQGIFLVVLLVGVFVAATGYAHGSVATPALSNEGQQIGTVLFAKNAHVGMADGCVQLGHDIVERLGRNHAKTAARYFALW